MVGAHQNLNGSRDLTTPFQGWFDIDIHGLALATINPSNKFELYLPHFKDMKGDTKYQKLGGLE